MADLPPIKKYWQTYKSILVDTMGNWIGCKDNPLYVTTGSGAPIQTTAQKRIALGYAQITDLAAVHKFGETGGVPIPDGTLEATIVAGVGMVSFIEAAGGSPPSATYGMPLPPGVPYRVAGADLPNLRMIAADAGAMLNVTFYGAAP